MEAVDLFCGAGLASEALRLIGVEPVAAADQWHLALDSYGRNHRTARRFCADLFKTDIEDVFRALQVPQSFGGVIWMSPPCQDCSIARAALWKDDRTRASLRLVARIVASRPKAWVFIENVAPITSPRYIEEWSLVQDAAASHRKCTVSRLWAAHYLFDAWRFGSPQNRTRLILPIPPRGKNLGPLPIPSDGSGMTIRDVIGPGSGFKDPDPDGPSLTDTELSIFKGMPPGGNWRSTDAGQMYVGDEKAPDSFARRCAWSDIPPTVLACKRVRMKYGNFVHPTEDRRFTLGEMRAFQTIPPRYRIEGAMTERQKQIGNAIPVRMVSTIVGHFLRKSR